ADHQQFCGDLLYYIIKYSDHVKNALHFTEIRGVDNQRFPIWANRLLEMILLLFLELFEINEVRDDFNFPGDLERREGLLSEVFRNRGHAVGLVDTERHDGFISRILTHQRDVRAV